MVLLQVSREQLVILCQVRGSPRAEVKSRKPVLRVMDRESRYLGIHFKKSLDLSLRNDAV
jgi:hypothetical protein